MNEYNLYREDLLKIAKQRGWDYVSDFTLEEDFIIEFHNELNWSHVSKNSFLNKKLINEFSHKVNWVQISYHQKLSENFIEEFKHKVDWTMVALGQTLAFEFILKYVKILPIDMLLSNEKLTKEIKQKIKELWHVQK